MVSSSQHNTHIAEHVANTRFTIHLRNLEEYSFKHTVDSLAWKVTKTLVTAMLNTKNS